MRSGKKDMRMAGLGVPGLRSGIENRVPKPATYRPISEQPALWSAGWWVRGLGILLLLAGLAGGASPAATLPVITVQPQSQTAAAGAGVTFSVAVVGGEPVSYEWWNEFGAIYPSQTGSTLSLVAVQPSDAGHYKVQVRNLAGTVTSSSATLVVNSGPTENFLIARKRIGTGADPGGNVDLDSAGNVYAAGSFTGSATFGAFTLTSAGGKDIFVVKFDRTGSVVWARRAGGAGDDAGAGVAVDRMGNVHVAGTFKGNAGFGGPTLASGVVGAAFVAVFDRHGTTLWARKVGGTGTTRGHRIACDAAGNTLLLGSFTGIASSGGTTLASAGDNDVFLAKFSVNGVPLWAKRFGGPGAEQGTGLALDPDGNALVTGSYQDTANFGGMNLSGGLEAQTFLVKCDRAGSVLWAKQIAGVDSEAGTTVVAEDDGSCDLTGTFSATTTIGTTTLTSRELGDRFVAKYDSAGHVLWAARAAGAESYLGLQAEDAAVTGRFGGGALDWSGGAGGGVDLVVVKYSEPGVVMWAKQAGASQASFSLGLMTDGEGKRYLTGFFEDVEGIPDASVALLAQLSLARAIGPPPPLITLVSQGQTVLAGSSATFGVMASGASAVSYQWRFNGADIAGGNSATFTLNTVRLSDAGAYSVVVFNADGSATSTEALLTVQGGSPPGQPTNALVLSKAGYHGLFYEVDGVEHHSSGGFSLATAAGGRFSAVLTPGGTRFAISGRFDAAGRATRLVQRAGTNVLNVALELITSNGVDQVVGQIASGGWTAELWAGRDAAGSPTSQVASAGRYTLAIPGGDDAAPSPGGSGFGSANVDARGRLKLSATLGDGSKLSQAVPLSTQGLWPLYGRLYAGKGSVLGWVLFADRPADDFLGLLSWISPSQANRRLYPAGYEIDRPIIGSRYVRLVPNTNRVVSFDQGLVEFTGGNLPGAFANEVRLGTNNKVTNLGSNKLTLNLVLPSGQFNGRVIDPVTGRGIPFKGAVLQKRAAGFGQFMGTNQTGRVFFGP